MNVHIDIPALLSSLPMMGKGMLSIFIVMGLIGAMIMILNKVTSKKDAE